MPDPLFAQKRSAASEDLSDGIRHLYEALHGDWLPAEAYVEGKIALQFDYWVRADDVDGGFKHLVAVLQRAPGYELAPLRGRVNITSFEEVELQRIRSLWNRSEGGQQGSMFVFVGESPQPGQDVCAWAVRSLVWLAEVDEVDGGGMQTPDLPVPRFAVSMAALLRRQLVEDWKGISPRRLLPVCFDENPHQVIEGGSEVLDEITRDRAPGEWRLADDMDIAEISGGLHIYLGDESIGLGFRFHEGLYNRAQRVEMKIRSLDLLHATGQGIARVDLSPEIR